MQDPKHAEPPGEAQNNHHTPIVGGSQERKGGSEPRGERPDAFASRAVYNEVEGAPPSNTAPSNSIEESETRILRVGVDTLFLSYPGELFEESGLALETYKALAQSKDKSQQKLAQCPLLDHLFEVKDRGRHPYAYILSDNWYRIQLSKPFAEQTPLAHVRVASEPLTFQTPASVEEDLRQVIDKLGFVSEAPSVSWVDLCVDFTTSVPLEAITEDQWVTRARNFARYTDKRRYSGISIGQGGQMGARLYNKTLEMEKKPRPYLSEIWRDLGWEPEQDVWRLEFQFRREKLRALGIKTFDELLSGLSYLWGYATEDWLRLTVPNSVDGTKSRWPTHPLWFVLQQADWGIEQKAPILTPSTARPPSDKYLFINGLSGVTSYMAREGITDIYSGIQAYLTDARDFHQSREHFTGVAFEDYVDTQVQLKAKKYCTMQTFSVHGEKHPVEVAIAKEYRKRSNGG